MEQIWNFIEQEQNGKVCYNKEKLDLILRCLDDEKLLNEIDKTLVVGVDPISSYINYFNKIKDFFAIGSNIIELGFGDFPIMSFLIDQEQRKINQGQIIAYDGCRIAYSEFEIEGPQKTSIAPLGNIIYNFERIDQHTNLPPYDLIFGIKTCKGLINLVERANKDQKDFFLVPCDCYPPEIINYLYNLALKGTDSSHELIIDDSLDKAYPILVRKKKKREK
ncbi:MAG: hypothetical protein IJE89_05370 [Bacilli bacterium]|nr:hypothetical protein [Bacilli bacterium]